MPSGYVRERSCLKQSKQTSQRRVPTKPVSAQKDRADFAWSRPRRIYLLVLPPVFFMLAFRFMHERLLASADLLNVGRAAAHDPNASKVFTNSTAVLVS